MLAEAKLKTDNMVEKNTQKINSNYKWVDGDIYSGNWENGKKNGLGS